jgi:hypothetical protein
MKESETPPDFRALCTNIGAAIIGCQTVERLLNLSMQWLFPREPIRTVEMLDQLEQEGNRKTLGQFIRALRERVELAPDFDELLSNFLAHRNTLVHDVARVDGHTFCTPEGIEAINKFVLHTLTEASRLIEIFAAFIDVWTEQVGMRDDLKQELPEVFESSFFANLRTDIAPILENLIHKEPKDKQ